MSYFQIPDLKESPQTLYSEDDCIKISNSYFKAIKDRMREILAITNYTNDEIEEILKFMGYAINHVKDEKSINDMFKI